MGRTRLVRCFYGPKYADRDLNSLGSWDGAIIPTAGPAATESDSIRAIKSPPTPT